ncbi:hypothetical protein KY290_008193 [Solanum tuberosum]|uniref:Aminotransferase-like plant mobile domain-containing protein n=1 Tax=Solanum tuberosum TaxID=4113 RepID=A0ABQ7W7R0_SOLTU|nr:hypothetical protein KY290_008193 [Solanum tuberosum]
MTEDQFIWEPYSANLIESLPDYCHVGRDIWRARVPIFCSDVVEVHLPDRVMRQFGLVQEIPSSFPFDATHFHHDRRGRPNTNWELEHAQWYDDPYLIWFRRITRFVIGNPTSRPQQLQGYVPNATAYEKWRGKGGVAGRRVYAVERGRAPIEMGNEDQATQDVQAAPEYEPTNTEIVPYMTP